MVGAGDAGAHVEQRHPRGIGCQQGGQAAILVLVHHDDLEVVAALRHHFVFQGKFDEYSAVRPRVATIRANRVKAPDPRSPANASRTTARMRREGGLGEALGIRNGRVLRGIWQGFESGHGGDNACDGLFRGTHP
jgi:hypothetical protein